MGIAEVRAEVLPADKAQVVGELKACGLSVAMVGDGINDAPAPAAADVGFSMSTDSEVAMHAAGVRWCAATHGWWPTRSRSCERPTPS